VAPLDSNPPTACDLPHQVRFDPLPSASSNHNL
jgi:hypothetical protein